MGRRQENRVERDRSAMIGRVDNGPNGLILLLKLMNSGNMPLHASY